MSKEILNVHRDLLPSDIFLRDVFDKNGPDALADLINGYLDRFEEGGYHIVEYSTPNGHCTRQEFVEYNVNTIASATTRLEARVSAEPLDSQERRPSQKLNELLETNDLFGLLQEIITHEGDSPTVPDVYIHEDMMLETYRQYIDLVREQTKARRLKEQIAQRFAYHVAEWYHIKYNHTKPDNIFSAKMYYIMKYSQMKTLMPDLPRFRSLLAHVDTTDEWTREWLQTEDGSSLGGGICNTNAHN
jgi:hypothetical protein